MVLAAVPSQSPGLFWIWPFAALLLCLAILPLVRRTADWWHHNRNKLLVAIALAAVTLVYYHQRGFGVAHGDTTTEPGVATVVAVARHAVLDEYFPFIVLLLSLYTIAGGIVVRGDLRATPAVNTAILALGGVIASVVGTTGASMVLIRLLLNSNKERRHVVHTVVFFIFIVSNVGGCLLPIGDPPLFIGYLRGVPFFWTLQLVAEWAVVLTALLIIYYVWDTRAYRHERPTDLARDVREIAPVQIVGAMNIVYLIGVTLAIVLLVPGRPLALGGLSFTPPRYLREGVELGLMALSFGTTAPRIRREGQFSFGPINEVACLFIGIFITMQVPIEILHAQGPTLAASGFVQPWQYFWGTGILSSFLDNAPTYVVFFETANQLTLEPGPDIIRLTTGEFIRGDLLAAISCGAVFMGAMTYIGNGPNFMVKSIAEQAGVQMPSFLGFMAYSCAVLLPLLLAVTFMFFV